MTTLDRFAIAQQFHRNVQVSRAQIFGSNDPVPLHLREDAETMFAGYVGPDYKPGGVVLLAINPGGGGDKYVSRTMDDARLYPLLRQFKDALSADEQLNLFETINDSFKQSVSTWNLRKLLNAILDSLGLGLDDIAFLNAVPYRTRDDTASLNAASLRPAKRSAWNLVTSKSLKLLEPGRIIALGVPAHEIATENYNGSAEIVLLKRTNGDHYFSEQAEGVFSRFREERGFPVPVQNRITENLHKPQAEQRTVVRRSAGPSYRLGTKEASEGNVWATIRNIVKRSPGYIVSYEKLLFEMQTVKCWSERVTTNPSQQVPGSAKWCHGYIKGAVRKCYLEEV